MNHLEDYLQTQSYFSGDTIPIDYSMTISDIFSRKDIVITRAYVSEDRMTVVFYQNKWKRTMFDLKTGTSMYYELQTPDPQKDIDFKVIWSLYGFRPTRTPLESIKKYICEKKYKCII